MNHLDHLAKCTRVRDPGEPEAIFTELPKLGPGRARTVAILLSLSFMCLLSALGDVVCTWSDLSQTYICSGEGSQVVIGGGGPGGSSPVVTNDLGSCTNCSAISPQALAQLADDLYDMRDYISTESFSVTNQSGILMGQLNHEIQEIGTFQSGWARPSDATNYAFSAHNAQASAMLNVFQNTSQTGNTRNHQVMGAGNGIYYYAHYSVLPTLQASLESVYGINQYGSRIHDLAKDGNPNGLEGIETAMRAGAVACSSCGGDGDGGGDCGGTNTTMWCTFEQGEAMKSLLSEMSNYLASCSAKLASISNYTFEAWQAIRSGLFTDYTAIPDSSILGDTWQNVYLSGSETSWGYAPTNILSRIELLLYGISGVGTNENLFSSISTNGVFDSFDQSYANLESSLNLTTDWDDTDTKSFGNAVVSFFRAFEVNNEPLYVDTQLIPSVNLSEQRRDGSSVQQVIVPSIHVGAESLSAFNSMQSISRAGFSILYAFGSATLVFMFWMGYIHKATKFIRWITQIVQNFLQ